MKVEPIGLPPRGQRRIVVMAEGMLNLRNIKTAIGIIRYSPDQVVAVLDSVCAGRTLQDCVTGALPGNIPVVASIEEAMQFQPNVMLIGIAPRGGCLPDKWHLQLASSLEKGIHLISGLHVFLNDNPGLQASARKGGAVIWDARRPLGKTRVALGEAMSAPALTVLTVGTDSSIGKMTAALELDIESRKRGYMSTFLATGQTGIIITGNGAPIDSITGDFMAGAIEELVLEEAQTHRLVFIEGQGSLLHLGYSAVTLALMHGSQPDAMVLCTKLGISTVHRYSTPIPPIPDLVRLHETIAGIIKPAKVIGICVNTSEVDGSQAHAEIARIQTDTGLPTTDPVRYGVGPLLDAIEQLPEFRSKVAKGKEC